MSRRSPRRGVKRVYEPPDASDGMRVLVDRIWPRGLTKEHASVDVWLKDIAPSSVHGSFVSKPQTAKFIRKMDPDAEVGVSVSAIGASIMLYFAHQA